MPLSVVGLDPLCSFYVRQVADGPVLVLGAADGAVACAIAARGTGVVAVDPSARMIELAISRREAQAVTSTLRFLNADLRTCRLTERFDVVLVPQNALGLYPDDLPAVCETIAAHLAPGGRFALDTRADAGLPEPSDEESALTRRAWLPHLRTRGAIHRYHQRPFHPLELDGALSAAGLEARERYADFSGRPFVGEAAQQVVVGGRRGAA